MLITCQAINENKNRKKEEKEFELVPFVLLLVLSLLGYAEKEEINKRKPDICQDAAHRHATQPRTEMSVNIRFDGAPIKYQSAFVYFGLAVCLLVWPSFLSLPCLALPFLSVCPSLASHARQEEAEGGDNKKTKVKVKVNKNKNKRRM